MRWAAVHDQRGRTVPHPGAALGLHHGAVHLLVASHHAATQLELHAVGALQQLEAGGHSRHLDLHVLRALDVVLPLTLLQLVTGRACSDGVGVLCLRLRACRHALIDAPVLAVNDLSFHRQLAFHLVGALTSREVVVRALERLGAVAVVLAREGSARAACRGKPRPSSGCVPLPLEALELLVRGIDALMMLQLQALALPFV
mmetsp:Transcript_33908/g.88835  ORF Transcript_33908/g.88835 Transcript_33908/m.88835 type:complete len:201 (-) Transcript_33908:224-826(-)